MAIRTIIKYNGNIISDSSSIGTKTLITNGKLMGGNIEVITTNSGEPRPSTATLLMHLDSSVVDEVGTYTAPVLYNATYATGKFNQGLQFSNVNNYVLLDKNILPYGSSSDFTAAFWAYPTSFSGNNVILCSGDTNGNADFAIRFQTSGQFNIGARVNDNWCAVSASTKPTLNAWNHCAMVRSGSTLYGFLNGALVTSTSCGSGTLTSVGTDYKLTFGRHGMYSSSANFVGILDELIICKSALWTTNFTPPTEPYS